jgi:hypothetical protein
MLGGGVRTAQVQTVEAALGAHAGALAADLHAFERFLGGHFVRLRHGETLSDVRALVNVVRQQPAISISMDHAREAHVKHGGTVPSF